MKPYYQDSAVTIYHGDCKEIVPTLGKFDLLLTDPPYGTELLGGGYGRQKHSTNGSGARTIAGDKDLRVAGDALAICRKHIDVGYAVTFCAARKMEEALKLFPNSEFIGELIWDKACPGLGYTIRYSHESALVFKVGNPEKPNKALLSVVRVPVSHIETQSRHPHEKPVDFWLNAMNLPGLNILDPFAGSGQTGVSAKALGRKCVLIEIEERYCEIAARRMLQEVLPMFEQPINEIRQPELI